MRWEERIGRRVKLRDVHILMTVAQSGSMGRAAAVLSTSQPAVSKAISDLEHALGVRLVDRTPHGTEPTIYGRALLKWGVAAFDDLRQGVREIEFLSDPTSGELRIGSTEPIAAGLLPVAIADFAHQHPRVRLFVTQVAAMTLPFHDLRERTVELMLGRLSPTPEDDMETEVLFDDRLLVVAGKQNPLANRRRIRLADIADAIWTLPAADTIVGAHVVEAFRTAGLGVPRATVTSHSIQMHGGLLANGNFLAMLPHSLLLFSGSRLSLKALPLDLGVPSWPVGMVRLKNRTLSPVAELFVACIRRVVEHAIK